MGYLAMGAWNMDLGARGLPEAKKGLQMFFSPKSKLTECKKWRCSPMQEGIEKAPPPTLDIKVGPGKDEASCWGRRKF